VKIIFNDHIFSWQKYGGISRYFYELANTLSLDPTVLIKVASPLYVNEYFKSGSSQIFSGIKVPSGNLLEKGYHLINRSLAPLYIRSFKLDIFHETYYSSWGERVGGAKRVLTVYDMIHERLPQYFDPKDKTPMRKAAAVKRADHIICISESTRSDLIELLGVPYEKTSVVSLGFSFGNVEDPVYAIDGLSPFLLYVGQRGGYKNFLSLLTVYAKNSFLKNHFQLIAFGGGEFTKEEKERLTSLNLNSSKVRQISGGDDILKGLYKKASLFVYPSKYEGFGIPPLEAMSMGCPVACSNTSSLPKVVCESAILFDPNSQGSMTNAILECLTNEVTRTALISKGRERVQYFSWHKCAQETKAVYERLLS